MYRKVTQKTIGDLNIEINNLKTEVYNWPPCPCRLCETKLMSCSEAHHFPLDDDINSFNLLSKDGHLLPNLFGSQLSLLVKLPAR